MTTHEKLKMLFPMATRIFLDKKRKYWHADIPCPYCGDIGRVDYLHLDGGTGNRRKETSGLRRLACYSCRIVLRQENPKVEPVLKALYNQQRKTAMLRRENIHDVVKYVIAVWTRKIRQGAKIFSPLDLGPIPEKCPYLGIRLKIWNPRLWHEYLKPKHLRSTKCLVGRNFSRGRNFDLASLDRVDSSKEYVTGNIQWTSLRFNILKSDATSNELIALGKAGKQIKKEKM